MQRSNSLEGLSGRNLEVTGCGCEHDRDQNAALNILARGSGHRAPVEGIPALKGGEDVKYNAATKTMMPAKFCVQRGEWEE